MKLERYGKRNGTILSQILVGLGISSVCIISLLLLGGLVLLLLERPLSGIGAAGLGVCILSGAFSGIFSHGKRWVGEVSLVGILCIISIITTKWHVPTAVLLGYAAHLGAYLCIALIPKKKIRRNHRYK